MAIIERGADGRYHPKNEDELRELVAYAHDHRLQLRVLGSGHSVRRAILPDAGGIEVMLDGYRKIRAILPDPRDPRHAVVEVEAGCNLGRDPYDPTHTSTWRNSLNYRLQREGYALDDLGGITHQTLSGFLSTGSSGGSLVHSVYDNVIRLRIIDGTGQIHEVSRDDPDPRKRDLFFAAGVSMGLCGVISRVWLRVGPTYNIFGKQVTSAVEEAAVDLFGGGTSARPGLERFLRETPYARLMWWPQNDFQRVQIWQAARVEAMSSFKSKPFEEMGEDPVLASLAGSLFYTIIGNLDDLSKVPPKLANWYRHLEGDIEGKPDENVCQAPRARARKAYTVEDVVGWIGARLEAAIESPKSRRAGLEAEPESVSVISAVSVASVAGDVPPPPGRLSQSITWLIRMLLDGALESPFARILARWFEKALPYVIHYVLSPFVAEGTVEFWDSWMCGLPMDNQMDDQLWPTEFTELWIPVERTAKVMQKLRAFYEGNGDPRDAYERTGSFACEIYGAGASPFWMSPAYGAAVVRVDVFWFGLNAGSPESFYGRFWDELEEFGFRPHWGKHLPPPTDAWLAYYKRQLPRLDAFLELRSRLDPRQIFVSKYWRDHFRIRPA